MKFSTVPIRIADYCAEISRALCRARCRKFCVSLPRRISLFQLLLSVLRDNTQSLIHETIQRLFLRVTAYLGRGRGQFSLILSRKR